MWRGREQSQVGGPSGCGASGSSEESPPTPMKGGGLGLFEGAQGRDCGGIGPSIPGSACVLSLSPVHLGDHLCLQHSVRREHQGPCQPRKFVSGMNAA